MPPGSLPSQGRRRPGGGPAAAGGERVGRPRRPAEGERPRAALRGPRPPAPGPRLPNPRLTGLGSGLFCALAMFLLGCLDLLLFGGSLTAYGVLFLPVCALTALWVHDGDLLTAPVVVPIAFVTGLLPVADGSGGLLGRLMGLVTALATQASWLYGGTLVAGVIVLGRRVRTVRMVRRRRRRI
ncbi:hypothetical protein NX794_14225 [Streptomyces sp. LP11]|uniref:DUF6542 domain-containing protein n=2 Tax=Streptomyces pyxinicus TaxID=2970331 RepID=A0ABT2B1Q1_9ACTN|nr:DUF6542 domain-containing protein [Streptomyces sp. LP11]MCS0602357.1 hypothetical protein [Streptomyces sp. LP11]